MNDNETNNNNDINKIEELLFKESIDNKEVKIENIHKLLEIN
jgi:hypothetical protein